MPNELPRCGRIAYTNDLPVYDALDEGALSFPGVMEAATPAQLNQALLAERLDISPISSAFYAEHADEFELLPAICIGAHERVWSICCISDAGIEGLRERSVAVTSESATGRMLLRLICRKRYGFDLQIQDSDDPFARYQADGTPCLLIGDKAVDATEQAPAASVHDVGELWHGVSGSGMVYAVWAVRNDYAKRERARVTAVARALSDSLEWGLANLDRVIARAQGSHPRAAGFYQQYYRALRFHFDDEMRAALRLFIRHAHEAGLLAKAANPAFADEVTQHV